VVVISSAKLFQASQTNKLQAKILILHAFSDTWLAINPLILLAAVSLANVVEDVLQL